MLILGDKSQNNGRLPWVTFSLIAINILVYCAQCFLGDSFTRGFSLVPKEISTFTDLTKPERVVAKVPRLIRGQGGRQQVQYREVDITIAQAPGPFPIFLTLLTSMFLHGSWLHLIGNMWFLAIFGRNVECALNHGRFLAFYLACGILGGLVYTATDAASVLPALGASGAISGVLGAYVAINPLNPISIWFGFYFGIIPVPAFIVVGVWFIFQYLDAFQALELGGTNIGGTAYWAHIGGFLAGIAIIWGVVFTLKHREASAAALIDEEPDVPGPAHQEAISADDPFQNCLPPSTALKTPGRGAFP